MFFLWLIVIVVLITLLFYTLSIKLEFEKFIIKYPKEDDEKQDKEKEDQDKEKDKGKIKLKIYLFGKIKITDINLKNIKRERIKFEQIKNLLNAIKQKRKTADIKIKGIVKDLKIDTQKFNLEIVVGIKDAATTAIIVGIIYILLENLVINKSKKLHNQKCLINPSYNEEIIWVKFDGIFNLNMRNIINTLFKQLKRRVKENDRTSNRKFNVFSNE